MKQWIALAATLAVFAATAQTPEPKKPLSAQQLRMAECNKSAGARKGDERRAFMKTCLSKKKVAARPAGDSAGATAAK